MHIVILEAPRSFSAFSAKCYRKVEKLLGVMSRTLSHKLMAQLLFEIISNLYMCVFRLSHHWQMYLREVGISFFNSIQPRNVTSAECHLLVQNARSQLS